MSKHIKRLAAPRSWKVARKGNVWVVRPQSGKHPIGKSVPLLVILRDYLGICDNRREAKRVVGNRDILIDGVPAKDVKIPVGLMDCISIPKMKAYFRVVLDKKGKIVLVSIDEAEAEWKLARINDKTMIKGGRLQLNLHDGRNILVDKDSYNTGDTLKLSLPDQDIVESYPFEEGSLAYLTGGNHVGFMASIENIERTRNPKSNVIHFKEEFSTLIDHVFIVGKDKSEIDLPEVVM